MALLRPTVWTQQPQVACEIDWSNPLAPKRGWVIYAINGQPYIFRRGVAPVKLNSGTVRKVWSAGIGFGMTSDTSNGAPVNTAVPGAAAANGTTVMFVAQHQVVPTVAGPRIYDADSGSRMYWTTATNLWTFSIASGTASPVFTMAGDYASGHPVVFSHDGTTGTGTGARGWIRGVEQAVTNTTVGSGGTSAWSNVVIAQSTANTRGWIGAIGILYVDTYKRSPEECAALSANPWQIFQPIKRRIFVPVSSGATNGTGIGDVSPVSLSTITGTATGTGAANGTATGDLAAVSLSAITASASGSALATAAIQGISLTAPLGSASAGTSATATGSIVSAALSAPSAAATGSALATGALTAVTLTTITGSAVGSALATGAIDQIDLSTVSGTAFGTAAGNATGIGAVATIALSAPTASALGTALATGTFAPISLSTVTGSASNATNATATGDIQAISISAPLAIAIASSVATGGIQSIGLTAPLGSASSAVAPLFTQEQLDYLLAYMEANMAVPTAAEIAAEVVAQLNATTIPVDMQKTNGVEIVGNGTSGDKFRSVLYVG